MPKIPNKVRDETPENLRPYLFHGVDLQWKNGDKNAAADCPFCGREGKFNVEIATSKWRCVVCDTGGEKAGKSGFKGGNATVFIRKLHETSKCQSTLELIQHRRLLLESTLKSWGLVRSAITDEWLVPGYGIDSKLNQLYRYVQLNNRWLLLPTPTLGHQLHYVAPWNSRAEQVCLMEGPWDGMVLYELLARVKADDSGNLSLIENGDKPLSTTINVVAVPGCAVFNEKWSELFGDKIVNLMYDNDHPRKHPTTGVEIPPAGLEGMKRVAGMLLESKKPPKQINYLKWGNDGEGYNLDLPSGYDVRDAVAPSGSPLESRITLLDGLLDKMVELPETWLKHDGSTLKTSGGKGIDPMALLPCEKYTLLIQSWRKAMRWTDGLDCALSVMLACIISTKSIGDQLWAKIISPASSGKSVLCEAISANSEYVLAKSTFRGFHSGYGEEGEDHSLISKVGGKTLVTKDGDTLMKSPNVEQILSEARDIYDTVSRTSYRNKKSKDYQGVRMTWILCGTSSLRSLDASELGERFLDCVIMDGIDEDLEDEILERVAHRAARHVSIEADGKLETQQDSDMTQAMQLTGGYVQYLRRNAQNILSTIEISDQHLRLCTRFGKFVAFMRARPSTTQDEEAEREFAARLVSQHTRLAKCLAAVLNRSSVDAEVIRRTRKVALDTSRGQTLEIVNYIYSNVECEVIGIAKATHKTEEKTRTLLRFLREIGVVYLEEKEVIKGIKKKPKWKLTDRMRKLYSEVMEHE